MPSSMNAYFRIICAICALVIFSCYPQRDITAPISDSGSHQEVSHEYAISPVDIQSVRLTDDFWLPMVQKIQEKTISYALQKCEEEGRMNNFLRAGGEMDGAIEGAMPFDDTDLYKIIEGASNSLISAPDPELESLIDELIEIIATGQEEDGYLTTWRTVQPDMPPAPWVKVIEGVRWESLEASHELYNPGHLYEAAVRHYQATGKRNFLDIAIKNADLMVKTFGDGPGQIAVVPGHQIIETGLLQLYRVTKNEDYLALAKYFLDNRGNPDHHELFGPYSQDHIPVVEQDEVVGHAVRAVYMYTAMTDIAVLLDDESYGSAVDALWENMVNKKMYVTGGIGARHEGESFGENYELPNLTAYSETCAAIGSIYWNHRLHQKTGDVKYFDIIERTLYNGMIAGISLDGVKFFYPNALASDGVYTFNRGHCTRQGWFDCSCCPTNVIRFLPTVSSLIYSHTSDEIFVNLFVDSEATIVDDNADIKINQRTSYPWQGGTVISVDNGSSQQKTLKIRAPHHLRGDAVPGDLYSYIDGRESEIALSINGKSVPTSVQDGYLIIEVPAAAKSEIVLSFDNEVRLIQSNDQVVENKGTLSVEYGPFTYAIESMDNEKDIDLIKSSRTAEKMRATWAPDLLGGVMTINSEEYTAIPYFAWSNRGVGKMKVWIPQF